MRYVPFLDLSVEHPYYPDGRCAALSLEPTDATWRLARNHRCELRSRLGGIRVLVGVDAEGRPFLPSSGVLPWRFRLKVTDPALYLMTDLAQLEALSAPCFVLPETADAPLSLKSGSEGSLPVGVLADVELELAITAESPVAPTPLRIELASLAARWAYYCVTDFGIGGTSGGNKETHDLSLVSVDPKGETPGEILFLEAQELGSDTSDPVAESLASRFPNLRRLLFLSETKIACRRIHKDRIQLRQGTTVLAGPLPTPSIHRRRAVVGSDEVELFQVVRYLNNASI